MATMATVTSVSPYTANVLTFAERLLCHVKILSLNLALNLGCLNPKILKPNHTNPNQKPNSNPNNCYFESN